MKRAEVRVGGIYLAKISGRLVRVRLDDELRREGWRTGRKCNYWLTTNLDTGRNITIRSAAKLRSEVVTPTHDE